MKEKNKNNYRRIRQRDVYIDNEKIRIQQGNLNKIKTDGTIRLLIEFLFDKEIILLNKIFKKRFGEMK